MEPTKSYDEVMHELERLSEDEFIGVDLTNHLDDNHRDFKFEYAFESITERNTSYKRRNNDA